MYMSLIAVLTRDYCTRQLYLHIAFAMPMRNGFPQNVITLREDIFTVDKWLMEMVDVHVLQVQQSAHRKK